MKLFSIFFDSCAQPSDTEAQQRSVILPLLPTQQAEWQMHAPLTIGQPVPDFLLSPVKGISRLFYEVYCGEPMVILVADSGEQLHYLQDAIPTTTVLALTRMGEASKPLPWPQESGNLSLCQRLTGCAGGKVHALLLSHELRLLARLETPLADSLQARCRLLTPPPEPRQIEQIAPVLMVPDVIDRALCQRLIQAWQQDHNHSCMVRRQSGRHTVHTDPDYKTRQDHALTNPELNSDLNQCLVQGLLPVITRCFHFNADRFEGFKVVAYQGNEHGHFAAHRDNISADTRHRRFAMTINLNDNFQGGELVFPEFGPHRYRPAAGGAIVFSCSLLHRVTPVIAGCRFATLTFFWSGALR